MMIGHEIVGSGEQHVLVLNDWLSDTQSGWAAARPYLDDARFTWAFADLRGYGRSLDQPGSFTLPEAAQDVLDLAGALGWQRFAIVGHSMSCLVALHLAQQHAECIQRAVAITPVPPSGLGVDATTLAAMEATVRGDDTGRLRMLGAMWGDRLSERWVRYKLARWRATSSPEAAARYLAMFARDGFPDKARRIDVPVLAITGEQDADVMRRAAVIQEWSPLCEQLVVAPLADTGHYPMHEAPPLLVSTLERFLKAGA
jgi:pimeloyl-ACP methyl ester carboxylesterase